MKNSMKYPRVSYRFKELLNEYELTAQELSALTNVGKASISHYVNGTHSPSLETADKIASHFDVNPAWLMGLEVPKIRLQTVPLDIDTPKYQINPSLLKMRKAMKNINYADISNDTNIPEDRVKEIFNTMKPMVSDIELRDISAFFKIPPEAILYDPTEPATNFYNDIMQELEYIKRSLGKTTDSNDIYSSSEAQIIEAFRNSDELTQAMVLRTLGLD